ncbi:hypothetical protein OHU11_29865 [Streptomyces sp. NBC_00257]|uniref:hypothetical protein n=1 Tax=unclassified Streptomyces TaxID=2593676 RepID=UPI002256A85E|nr:MULTISPECIES: hypothetical protein [unclassified Streptomyces]MCX5431858.1 hypothetical protein [Streptomyces sp. NBC_00062]
MTATEGDAVTTEFVIKSEASAFDPRALKPVTVELSDGSRYTAHGFDPSAVQLQLSYMQDVAGREDAAGVLAELRNALLHTFDETAADELLVKARSAQNPVSITELFNDLLPRLVEHYEPELAAYQEEMGMAAGNREQRRTATKAAAKKTAAARRS